MAQLDKIEKAALKKEGIVVAKETEVDQRQFKKDEFRLKVKSDPTWHTELDDDGKVIFVNRKTGFS